MNYGHAGQQFRLTAATLTEHDRDSVARLQQQTDRLQAPNCNTYGDTEIY